MDIDRQKLVDFFDAIFRYCEKGQVEIRCIPPKKDRPIISKFLDPDPQILASYKPDLSYDVYFTVCLRNGGGTKDKITEIPALWIDIDNYSEQVKKKLREFPFKPTAFVKSGGGYHVYWRLKEPASKQEIPEIEARLEALAAYFEADPIAAEAARILRFPGTYNLKYNPKRLVEIAKINNKQEIDYRDLDNIINISSNNIYTINCNNHAKGEIVTSWSQDSHNLVTKVTNSHTVTDGHIGHIKSQWSQLITDEYLIKEHHRNDFIFHVVNALSKTNLPVEEIRDIAVMLAVHCTEPGKKPFSVKEAVIAVDSAFKRSDRYIANIADDVRAWVGFADGVFNISDYYREAGIVTRKAKHAVVVAFSRLVEEGIIKRVGSKRGQYRRVDDEIEVLDWENAKNNPLKFVCPLGTHKLVRLFPKNLAVIAGSKDAGKTAYALNFALLNRKLFRRIRYLTSEMGEEELKERLVQFDCDLEDWKSIEFVNRSSNFADVVLEDGLTIIDYFEVTGEFWGIAGYMKEIYEKLGHGICLICIQKDRNQPLGRGGSFLLEKPRLLINLDAMPPEGGLAEIVVGKNRVDPEVNPKFMKARYWITKGSQIKLKTQWRR